MMPGTLADLEDVGAYLRGHFLLTTGRHSDQFFLFARLTEYPHRLRPWVRLLAERLRPYGARTVAGPAVGGIIPAYAVAAEWPDTRVIFAEKDEAQGMTFKRGFQLKAGEPVVVVEDAVTTGSSVRRVVDAVARLGGTVVAVGALIDRSGGQADWGCPFESVLRLTVPSWLPEECPLCRADIPLTRPKS